MYKAFIEPDLKTAHIKIQNKFNPFSGFQNPTYILKVTTFILLKRVYIVALLYYSSNFFPGWSEFCYLIVVNKSCNTRTNEGSSV